MEFPCSFSTSSMALMFAVLLFLYYLLRISRSFSRNSGSKKSLAPEAGGAWPVIGHLHLLGGPQPSHITLGNMADKYGPIFTIRLGVNRALVVSNWEMAQDCLKTNDKAFANRPKSLAMELLGYNFSMIGFSPYGPYWRQVRKIATLELLSNHRLETLKDARETEVKASLKELYQLWVLDKNSSGMVLVEMKGWFVDVTLNVIMSIIVGKRSTGYRTSNGGEESDQWREALKDFFEMAGSFVVSDALPFLRWFDIGGHERVMKKKAKELDHVVEGWLEEHKRKRESGGKKDEDFMDVMLSILDDAEDFPDHDTDTINKATCLALILAASDTTAITLTWSLSLLLNNRDALKKVQQELDTHVGMERQVKESDMKSLVYLQAILKETLRLYPAGPLSIPHESMEDCTTGGYHVPAGTQLLVNISKIQRDPRVWSDPCEFKPERFLTTHKDFDVRGKNFEFIPFSSGRRMCPGISFALQVMQLTMANLLQGFNFATPSEEPVDMSEGVGMTNLKASPLEVLLTPRLPAELYI